MPPEIQVNDWTEYKQRVFYQLEEFAKANAALVAKFETMRDEVTKLKISIDNHPILCPLNPEEIEKIVKEEIRQVPKERLNNMVKYAAIISSIISVIAIVLTILK